MSSAGWALQKAVFEALTGDVGVTTLLGGAKVFDDVPRDTDFPYVTFGQSVERDWSTGNDEGGEHLVTLHVWSRFNGRREVADISDAVRRVLHDAELAVSGNNLVNLRHEFSDARREPDGETYRAFVRFRAVTEVVV